MKIECDATPDVLEKLGMTAFTIRGIVLSEQNAKKFKEDFIGQDWREKLVEGFNHSLKDIKEEKLDTKERHALYKWLTDAVK
jgi:hypothetical protein